LESRWQIEREKSAIPGGMSGSEGEDLAKRGGSTFANGVNWRLKTGRWFARREKRGVRKKNLSREEKKGGENKRLQNRGKQV